MAATRRKLPANKGHEATSPLQIPWAAWKDIAKRTWTRSWQDNVGLVAAGVAYYGFLALVPLLGIIVMLYGLFAEPRTVVSNVRALTAILPPDVARLIADQLVAAVQTTKETRGLGIVVALLVACETIVICNQPEVFVVDGEAFHRSCRIRASICVIGSFFGGGVIVLANHPARRGIDF